MHNLIGSAETARLLKCSRATVQRRALNGDLDVAYRGPGKTGAYLFDRTGVEALAKVSA
ncbi:hypothetical protein [Gordonia sp. CPCC 205333]|uniref:hypothetical protein n=1 Tax=Gordonia sp. CPCC 205333 TaxID=3140790 RepID=UPI003AF3B753